MRALLRLAAFARISVLLWGSVAVAGCSVESASSGSALIGDSVGGEGGGLSQTQQLGQAEQPIAGGVADTADSNVVAIVLYEDGGKMVAICSGSLLLPNMVLTARHCVSDTLNQVNGGVECNVTTSDSPKPAADFFVTTAATAPMDLTGYHKVNEVAVLPNDDTGPFCGNDQAILILASPVGSAEATPLTPRVDTALATGETYSAIGYGGTDDANDGVGTRRRRDGLAVNCVEQSCASNSAFMTTTEWLGDVGVCEGDSGGPALDSKNRVVGVTSRGSSGCGQPIYGSVHSWGEWIKAEAAHAAQVGGYAAPSWVSGFPTDPDFSYPIGGPCDSTCTSGVCLGGQCTRFCEDEAPCPANYECKLVNVTQSACGPVSTDSGSDSGSSSCAASLKDPTTPVPWKSGLVLGSALFAARYRRRSARSAQKLRVSQGIRARQSRRPRG